MYSTLDEMLICTGGAQHVLRNWKPLLVMEFAKEALQAGAGPKAQVSMLSL